MEGPGTRNNMGSCKRGKSMTLKFQMTAPAADWQMITSAIQTMHDTMTIDIMPSGLDFYCRTVENIAILRYFWDAKFMESYKAEKGSIAIPVDMFQKILKRFGKKDNVEMEITKENMISLKSGSKTFQMRHVAVEAIEKNIPKVEYPVIFSMPEILLRGILDDALVMGDTVVFESKNGNMQFKASDIEGNVSSGVPGLTTTADAEAMYAIDYIKPTLSVIGVYAKTITVKFDTVKPVCFVADMPTGLLSYYIAPKVERQQ